MHPLKNEIGGVGTQKMFYVNRYDDGSLSVVFCGFQGHELDDRMKTTLGGGVEVSQRPEESFWSWLWRSITSPFGG
jgi:hypothetical protein